ncbi:hypothetical protein AB6E89_01330 [Vibrio breoganii]
MEYLVEVANRTGLGNEIRAQYFLVLDERTQGGACLSFASLMVNYASSRNLSIKTRFSHALTKSGYCFTEVSLLDGAFDVHSNDMTAFRLSASLGLTVELPGSSPRQYNLVQDFLVDSTKGLPINYGSLVVQYHHHNWHYISMQQALEDVAECGFIARKSIERKSYGFAKKYLQRQSAILQGIVRFEGGDKGDFHVLGPLLTEIDEQIALCTEKQMQVQIS